MKEVKGFSKLSKESKLDFLISELFVDNKDVKETVKSFWHQDEKLQKTIDEFSENTISNFYSPFGVVPNLKINNKIFCAPMVIEESSVVAAASKAAKFWLSRGGFKAEVVDFKKVGQVHFKWFGDDFSVLKNFIEDSKAYLLEDVYPTVKRMEERGGGILDIELIDKTSDLKNYYQLKVSFDTRDAMGANFINSVLEGFAKRLELNAKVYEDFKKDEREIHIIMSILSNYTPECLVKVEVSAPVEDLYENSLGMDAQTFANKFVTACEIAKIDVSRATTHNKGIFNGIDSVVLATGNDFRAIEACGHAYAARDGKYRSLSYAKIENNIFTFGIEIPLSLGTVGGLTSLHPMSKFALEMLGNPDAKELMMVVGTVGLAQNFAAVRSLVTSGIQKGHMKMHLLNILNTFDVTSDEKENIQKYFQDQVISFSAVREYLSQVRQ